MYKMKKAISIFLIMLIASVIAVTVLGINATADKKALLSEIQIENPSFKISPCSESVKVDKNTAIVKAKESYTNRTESITAELYSFKNGSNDEIPVWIVTFYDFDFYSHDHEGSWRPTGTKPLTAKGDMNIIINANTGELVKIIKLIYRK